MNYITSLKESGNLKVHLIMLVCLLGFIALFHSTFEKLITVWLNSHTYGHGAFIPPIVAWLIYRQKDELITLKQSISPLGFIGLLCLGGIWFIARLAEINAIEQFAVLAMPIPIVYTFWGLKGLKLLSFPLVFLLFAVPVGDFLIPYLQFITADISVFMLELLNIPVYRDGMFIQIPNGNFLVAEACSGIRFLISTFTIGVLFAYLNMQSFKKRFLFILLSLVVPIFANGLRAFLMILIGYLSDMQAAVGFDHLVYGWLFFSFVLVILLTIGHFMADAPEKKPVEREITKTMPLPKPLYIGITLFMVAIGPMLYKVHQYFMHQKFSHVFSIDNKIEHSEKLLPADAPKFNNADEVSYFTTSTENNAVIERFTFKYLYEESGKELIGSQNQFFNEQHWSLVDIHYGNLDIDGHIIPYKDYQVAALSGQHKIIRVTYQVNDFFVASNLEVKLSQLVSKILLTDIGGVAYIYRSHTQNITELETLMKADIKTILNSPHLKDNRN